MIILLHYELLSIINNSRKKALKGSACKRLAIDKRFENCVHVSFELQLRRQEHRNRVVTIGVQIYL